MQNDFDIYGDLEEDTIFTKGVIEKLEVPSNSQGDSEDTVKFIADLKQTVEDLKAKNRQLTINCSFLLTTSKAEIDRKNAMIHATRKELDSYLFKKRNVDKAITADKGTQTASPSNLDDYNGRNNSSQRDNSKRSRGSSRDRHRDTRGVGHRNNDYKQRSRSPRAYRSWNKDSKDYDSRRSSGKESKTSARSLKVDSNVESKKQKQQDDKQCKSVKILKIDDMIGQQTKIKKEQNVSIKSTQPITDTKPIVEKITEQIKLTLNEKHFLDPSVVDASLPEQILSNNSLELKPDLMAVSSINRKSKKSSKTIIESSSVAIEPLIQDSMKVEEKCKVSIEPTEKTSKIQAEIIIKVPDEALIKKRVLEMKEKEHHKSENIKDVLSSSVLSESLVKTGMSDSLTELFDLSVTPVSFNVCNKEISKVKDLCLDLDEKMMLIETGIEEKIQKDQNQKFPIEKSIQLTTSPFPAGETSCSQTNQANEKNIPQNTIVKSTKIKTKTQQEDLDNFTREQSLAWIEKLKELDTLNMKSVLDVKEIDHNEEDLCIDETMDEKTMLIEAGVQEKIEKDLNENIAEEKSKQEITTAFQASATSSPETGQTKENVLQNANPSGNVPWIWNTKKSEYRREVEDGQTVFYVTRKKKNKKKADLN